VPPLLDLPGVGPYTAGAIAAEAFGAPAPAVDTNVLRVVARLRGLAAPAAAALAAGSVAIPAPAAAAAAVATAGDVGAGTRGRKAPGKQKGASGGLKGKLVPVLSDYLPAPSSSTAGAGRARDTEANGVLLGPAATAGAAVWRLAAALMRGAWGLTNCVDTHTAGAANSAATGAAAAAAAGVQWSGYADAFLSSEMLQGLMELGATVCTPRRATCEQCPLRPHCRAYAEQRARVRPAPPSAWDAAADVRAAADAERDDGAVSDVEDCGSAGPAAASASGAAGAFACVPDADSPRAVARWRSWVRGRERALRSNRVPAAPYDGAHTPALGRGSRAPPVLTFSQHLLISADADIGSSTGADGDGDRGGAAIEAGAEAETAGPLPLPPAPAHLADRLFAAAEPGALAAADPGASASASCAVGCRLCSDADLPRGAPRGEDFSVLRFPIPADKSGGVSAAGADGDGGAEKPVKRARPAGKPRRGPSSMWDAAEDSPFFSEGEESDDGAGEGGTAAAQEQQDDCGGDDDDGCEVAEHAAEQAAGAATARGGKRGRAAPKESFYLSVLCVVQPPAPAGAAPAPLLLLRRRPASGVLSGQWDAPFAPLPASVAQERAGVSGEAAARDALAQLVGSPAAGAGRRNGSIGGSLERAVAALLAAVGGAAGDGAPGDSAPAVRVGLVRRVRYTVCGTGASPPASNSSGGGGGGEVRRRGGAYPRWFPKVYSSGKQFVMPLVVLVTAEPTTAGPGAATGLTASAAVVAEHAWQRDNRSGVWFAGPAADAAQLCAVPLVALGLPLAVAGDGHALDAHATPPLSPAMDADTLVRLQQLLHAPVAGTLSFLATILRFAAGDRPPRLAQPGQRSRAAADASVDPAAAAAPKQKSIASFFKKA
jgi:hypothetical protein